MGYGCQGPWWSALMDDVSSGDGKRSMFESSWPAFHHARPLAVTSSHVTATDPTTAISLSKQERASALAVFLDFGANTKSRAGKPDQPWLAGSWPITQVWCIQERSWSWQAT